MRSPNLGTLIKFFLKIFSVIFSTLGIFTDIILANEEREKLNF